MQATPAKGQTHYHLCINVKHTNRHNRSRAKHEQSDFTPTDCQQYQDNATSDHDSKPNW